MEINVILFGATGMIGQGVLIECLEDPRVTKVLSISRSSTGKTDQKLEELLHNDFMDFSSIEDQLKGYNACFFCLGVSSAGMKEEQYRRITYDFTVKAGEALSRNNPGMTFCFISGAGTDDKGKSRMMWARVKGAAENALKEMPFSKVYLMRPAFILAKKGVVTRYAAYNILKPVIMLLKGPLRKWITTTEEVGLAMLHAVLHGYEKQTLENTDIIELAGRHMKVNEGRK